MRVAIGGSTGLIGTALARHLIRDGHEVVRLVRGEVTASDQRHWDPDAGRIDGPGLDDVDAVVNLAGAPIAGGRWTKERKAEIRRSRITSTLTIVTSLAPDGRCQRLLNGSAIGYYGDTGTEIVDETMPAGRGFLAEWSPTGRPPPPTPRCRPRYCAPARCWRATAATWPCSGPSSPSASADASAADASSCPGSAWPTTSAPSSSCSRSDLTGPVNLSSPNPVSNAEFTRAFGRHLNRPDPAAAAADRRSGCSSAASSSTRRCCAASACVPPACWTPGFEFEHPQLRQAFAALG